MSAVVKNNPGLRNGVIGKLVGYLVVGGWALTSVFFVLWILSASLKTNRQLFTQPWSLPVTPNWANYIKAWVGNHFGDYFLNSALVVVSSVLGILLVSVPAAYVLARARFSGRTTLSNFFAFGMGIPFPLLFVPLFVLLSQFRLSDSLTGLTLAYVALSLPFSIYVLEGFFASLPGELENAAIIDGCSDFQVFRHVMLPLAMPGIATVAILNFVGLWNEYQWSLVLINSPENRTLALGLYSLISSMQYSGGDWVGLFAAVCIVMLPTIVIFILLSEKMISGITMGGVK